MGEGSSTGAGRGYDVFVSYAHADDDADADEIGWVGELVKRVGTRLRQILGPKPRVYIDTQLTMGQHVPEALLQTIRASRTLLLILSPSYCRSEWCRLELERFLDRGDVSRGSIFVVEAECMPRDEWPPALRDLKSVTLWEKEGDIAHRLDPLLGEKYATEFYLRANRIAHYLAERLKVPDRAPSGSVWIAEPTDDLIVPYEKLVAALEQAGWNVLRTSFHHEEGAYRERLRSHLREARLLVQLLGPYPGRRPDWSAAPYTLLQAEAARMAADARSVRWLRWRPKGTAAPDEPAEYGALLKEREVQQSTIEEFQSEVLRVLRGPEPPAPPPLAPPPPPAPFRGPSIYVHSADVDRALATEVEAWLRDQKMDTMGTPPAHPEEGPASVRARQLESLRVCDGAILVYGMVSRRWVLSQSKLMRKELEMARRAGPIGVLNGPPPKEAMPSIGGPVITLDCSHGLSPAVLQPFMERVRSSAQANGAHA
jgi:hypothetical protein